MADIVMSIVKTLSLVLNAVLLTMCLSRKRSLSLVVLGWISLGILSYSSERLLGSLPEFTILGSLLFVPLVLWAYSGPLFQMIFAMLLPMYLTSTQQMLVESILRLTMPFGTDEYWLTYLTIVLIMSAIYIYLVFRFGKGLLKRILVEGRTSEWMLYSFSSILSFTTIMILYQSLIEKNTITFIIALCAIVWGYIMLCFAIINTHEKLQVQFERDLSREIISSGRDYYGKLTDMSEQLHILRHDYKHHLISIKKLIDSSENDEARMYLSKLNSNAIDDSIYEYCKSRVLNALLDSFAQRCKEESIEFTVKIILPPLDIVDDYELCIILGNLLENAITACRRTPPDEWKHIDLSMRSRDDHYGIKVENSYDGVLKNEGKILHSTKKDGGLGIKSIQTVVASHNGEYIPVWDEKKFSAFVVFKLEE